MAIRKIFVHGSTFLDNPDTYRQHRRTDAALLVALPSRATHYLCSVRL
jgi:hypothetical protein